MKNEIAKVHSITPPFDLFTRFTYITVNGEVWFPATETARTLGYQNPERAIRKHCREIWGVTDLVTPTSGGNQTIKVISQPNLFRLLDRSRLKDAELYQDWLYLDVLPSIAKTGAYSLGQQPEPKREGKMRQVSLRLAWENMPNIPTGYFSVANEVFHHLYVRLARLNYAIADTYQIVEKGEVVTKHIRPDISVGLLFDKHLEKEHGCESVKYMEFNDDLSRTYRPRKVKVYSDMLKSCYTQFFNQIWLVEHAPKYFLGKDNSVLEYLPMLSNVGNKEITSPEFRRLTN